MVERLHMNYLRDLVHRLRAGDSERRIARDLGISRVTAHRYHQLALQQGYLGIDAAMPDDATFLAALGPAPRPPRIPSGLEPYQAIVQDLLARKVEMMALYQRLRDSHGYTGSYSSVRRYVHRLCPPEPDVVVRVHTQPGEEMQVDFGPLGRLLDPETGRLRLAYAFVATLSYSRHQYAELVFDQKTPTWIALHRRAFESFGGVPQRVVPDNLKAAVKQALVFDLILAEPYRRLALHYHFVISPTRPGTPQHKGKVESGIHYVQRNFMAGQDFADIRVANERLRRWVRDIAGTRMHGTTHQPPLRLFSEHEQAALQPLPPEPFTLCEVRRVKVHSDCHVVIEKSYYSVDWHHVGETLDAYIGERVVQLFRGTELIVTHMRSTEPGRWVTRPEDYPPDKAAYLQRTPERCRQLASQVGPATREVIEGLLAERPLDHLRSVQGILRLQESVGPQRLEAACARALYCGDPRYRRIKQILNAALDRDPLPEATPAVAQRDYAFARPASEFFAPAQEALL